MRTPWRLEISVSFLPTVWKVRGYPGWGLPIQAPTDGGVWILNSQSGLGAAAIVTCQKNPAREEGIEHLVVGIPKYYRNSAIQRTAYWLGWYDSMEKWPPLPDKALFCPAQHWVNSKYPRSLAKVLLHSHILSYSHTHMTHILTYITYSYIHKSYTSPTHMHTCSHTYTHITHSHSHMSQASLDFWMSLAWLMPSVSFGSVLIASFSGPCFHQSPSLGKGKEGFHARWTFTPFFRLYLGLCFTKRNCHA